MNPPLSRGIVTAGTVLFWAISGLVLFWMLGKGAIILGQRVHAAGMPGMTTVDFDVFVQAAEMFRAGQAPCLYDRACLAAAQKAAGFSTGLMSWNYPPVIALLLTPLHALDARVSYFALLAANLALAVGIGWRLGGLRGVLITLAYEPVAASLLIGQVSLAMSLALWLGLTALLRRPLQAGATLGLLVIKPHLAWVVPLALIGQGNLRILVRAGLGGVLVVAIAVAASLVWPGPAVWEAFLRGLGQAGEALAHHQFPWQQMPTLYVSLAALGAPALASGLAQAFGAVVSGGMVIAAWKQRPGRDAVAVTLIAATLASPYLYHYDLVCAGLGAALYLADRPWTLRRGAIAYLALLIPVVGLVENDLGALLDDNAWRIQPMGPLLLGLMTLTWLDARAPTETKQCTASTLPS